MAASPRRHNRSELVEAPRFASVFEQYLVTRATSFFSRCFLCIYLGVLKEHRPSTFLPAPLTRLPLLLMNNILTPPSERARSLPLLQDKISALIRPSPRRSDLSRLLMQLLRECSPVMQPVCANADKRKPRELTESGFHSVGWTQKMLSRLFLHFVRVPQICILQFASYFCQGQRSGCRN